MGIVAKEHRDVATADVVEAYLLADMNDFLIVKIIGESINIMCKVRSEYNKYLTKEKYKTSVLSLQLAKELSGSMQSALL